MADGGLSTERLARISCRTAAQKNSRYRNFFCAPSELMETGMSCRAHTS